MVQDVRSEQTFAAIFAGDLIDTDAIETSTTEAEKEPLSNLRCVICTDYIPQSRATRRSTTCSDQHNHQLTEARRIRRDERRCRTCSKPSTLEERKLFRQWRHDLGTLASVGRPKKISEASADIDLLMKNFGEQVAAKLQAIEKSKKLNGAWKAKDWEDRLRADIRTVLEKGDPVDVAAYCAFAAYHGWSLSADGQRDTL